MKQYYIKHLEYEKERGYVWVDGNNMILDTNVTGLKKGDLVFEQRETDTLMYVSIIRKTLMFKMIMLKNRLLRGEGR